MAATIKSITKKRKPNTPILSIKEKKADKTAKISPRKITARIKSAKQPITAPAIYFYIQYMTKMAPCSPQFMGASSDNQLSVAGNAIHNEAILLIIN